MKKLYNQMCLKLKYDRDTVAFVIIIFAIFVCSTSCKKFVDAGPPVNTLNSENVFSTDATAIAAVTGMYTSISNDAFGLTSGNGGLITINLLPALSGDDLNLFSTSTNNDFIQVFTNSSKSSNQLNLSLWQKTYTLVYKANAAVEGLDNNSSMSTQVKNQLLGEVYFMRAFCYFNLVNLYEDVPLVLSTNYANTFNLSKKSKSEIYTQIISDLKTAQTLLNDKYVKGDVLTPYVSGAEERVRPNKSVATALLARVYLYIKDYANAEIQSSFIISNKAVYDTVALNNVFLKNSKETIWSIPSVRSGTQSNTAEGSLFLPNSLNLFGPDTKTVYLSPNLMASFQTGDKRVTSWTKSIVTAGITYNYPTKYKIGDYAPPSTTLEYSMIMRLAEQYLIRAEARANLNNVTGSQDDINVIRKRAGLANTTASTQTALLTAVAQERRSELFTEWGHRWFDLKRTNTIDQVMSIVAPQKAIGGITGSWDTNWKLYPIPVSEIRLDPNLVQNPGYGSN
jgi:hypothetical protein